MDRICRKARSRLMSRIRSKDTMPEKMLWEILKELKEPPERWLNMPGKPDFVFASSGVVVFVDGCFWHRCPKHATTPKSNVRFWRDKFATNVARDKRVNRELKEYGCVVLRFWECLIKNDADTVLFNIETAIESRLDEIKKCSEER